MTAFWCEQAWLGGDHAVSHVLVDTADGLITSVQPGRAAAPPGATRLAGLTVPGLANTHSHAFHRALRGATQAGAGTFWTWRDQMYAVADRLDPDRYRLLARAVYAEMALAGITGVGEFHYLHHDRGGIPYADPTEMAAALVAAAEDVGLRITLLDTCYLAGGIGRPLEGVQRRFGDGDVTAWAARADVAAGRLGGGRTRYGAAIHSVRAVDPVSMATVARWAEARRAPVHVHLSEQPAENEHCIAAYGRSPTALLDDAGALGPATCAVHATHVTPADIAALGASGASVCLCPTTERDLADGIGPAAALRDAGCRLSVGTDSHAVIDVIEEARAVELDERLATGVRGTHRPSELLAAATLHGHRAIGWPECGRIEVGAAADLTTVRLDSVRTTGRGPALEAVVFAATAADVHHVVVGGEVVVRDGRHVRLDVVDELRQALGTLA